MGATLTIYITDAGNVGHSFVGFNDGTGAPTQYWGYHPSNHNNYLTRVTGPGTVMNDIGDFQAGLNGTANVYASQTYNLTPTQASSFTSYLAANNGGLYVFTGHNCADWVNGAIQAVGITGGSGAIDIGDLFTPYQLYDAGAVGIYIGSVYNGFPSPIFAATSQVPIVGDWLDDIYSSVNHTQQSPIVLDLNGDGIGYTSIGSSEVLFDVDNDGFAEHVEWIDGNDGFLVRDLNANGKIDNVTEMFGDNGGTSAYQKLATLDSNFDGKLTSADTQWASIKIWQDANENGVVDSGELKTLSSLNIASINVTHTNDLTLNGHAVAGTSTFTYTNSTTGQVADVLLETDQVNSWINNAPVIDSSVAFLPASRGYGILDDLQSAMSQNAALKGLVGDFCALNLATEAHTIYDKLETLILNWANAADVDVNKNGPNVDGRHLSVLEKVTDLNYFYNLENTKIVPEFYGDDLGKNYADFANNVLVKLLVQGPLNIVFQEATYDIYTDSIELRESLATLLGRAIANAPTNAADKITYWNEISRILDSCHDEFGLTNEQIIAQVNNSAGLQTHIIDVWGTSGNDNLLASAPGANYFDGSSDVFAGGDGDDFIGMGQGDDIVLFDGTSGNDTVQDGRGYDAIILQNATPANVALSVFGDNMVITISSLGEVITVQDQFETAPFGRTHDHDIEEIQFSNGVIWNQATLEAIAQGGSAPTPLTGTSGADTLTAGANDINITGLAGADIFKIEQTSSKFITITDFNYTAGDRIDLGAFPGITNLNDLDIRDVAGHATFTLHTATGDITVNLSGWSSGQITPDFFLGNEIGITSGSNIVGTSGNDVLNGTAGNDTIYCNEGSDSANGGQGHDTIYGWTLNDTLKGGYGNDALSGDDGNDQLFGDSGADSLYGGIGTDSLTGGEGNDYLSGDADNDSLYGGVGNDSLLGGDGLDSLLGGSDDDTIGGGEHNDSAFGEDGNDYLYGDNGTDSLDGGNGNDYLSGDAASDTLLGAAGNDILSGGAAADSLNGGADNDTASYSASSAAVNVNLTLATAQSGGDAAGDTLSSIENIEGSAYNDTITGDSNANLLNGAGGNDSLVGGAGNDSIIGGAGADTIDGGADNDTVSYTASTAAINVNLTLTTAQSGGDAASDILSGIENVEGSAYNDTIIGDTNANILIGNAGNDTITAGNGNDTIIGGAGADSIDGGANTDIISYASSGSAINVNLSLGTAQSGGDAAGDILAAIENLMGSSYNDVIQGTSSANTLDGSYGNDTVSYSSSSAAVNVNLSLATAQSGGSAAGDILSNFENLAGSNYNDTLTGAADANILDGGSGADSLIGAAGDDTLTGGAGADTLDGGSNTDTVSYAGSSSAVNIDLTLATAQSGGDAAGDLLSNIENVVGSNLNDSLAGGSGANSFDGNSGTDTVSYAASTAAVEVNLALTTAQTGGFAEGDVLANIENVIGSAYNDVLIGTVGANSINGGNGSDTVFYTASLSAITVDLTSASAQTGGDATGDTLASIENIVGSIYHDTIIGSSVANILDGSAGNDSITAGAGNDTLAGGQGYDTLDGGADSDTVSYANSTGGISIDLSLTTIQSGSDALGDILLNIEHAIGSDYNDVIAGNSGSNNLNGGAGNDQVSYANSTSAINVNLTLSGAQSGGYAAGDTLAGFENVLGSAYNDSITGDASDNILTGGAGVDSLVGGDGNDTIYGGVGADSLWGGLGNDWLQGDDDGDTLRGEDGNDTLIGGLANDRLEGGIGNDSVIGSTGDNYTLGGSGDDTMRGDADDDTIQGEADNDYVTGYSGADSILGGTGDDTILGGNDADVLKGDAGIDRLYGELGNDTLYGGTEADSFYFANGGGDDRIVDFEGEGISGGDIIRIQSNINSSGITSFATLTSHITYDTVNDRATIDLGGGHSIYVWSVTQNFVSSDFAFY